MKEGWRYGRNSKSITSEELYRQNPYSGNDGGGTQKTDGEAEKSNSRFSDERRDRAETETGKNIKGRDRLRAGREDKPMLKRLYAGFDKTDDVGSGPTEVMLVDAGKVRRVRDRAIKLRENVPTYVFGTLIKQVLEDLDLWEGGTQ